MVRLRPIRRTRQVRSAPMSLRDGALLVATSALMASAFLFGRIAAPAFGAYPLAALRVTGASLLLGALGLVVRRRGFRFVRGPGSYLVLGTLSVAAPFTLTAWAAIHLPATLVSVLAATLPLFTALAEAARSRRVPSSGQAVGLFLGFAGVVLATGFAAPDLGPVEALATLAVLAASLSYAVGTIYTKARFTGVDAASLTLGCLVASAALLTPAALATARIAAPGADALAALGGLVAVATVAASLLYYALLARQEATAANGMAYLVPPFGALYGGVFLGEPVGPSLLLGGVAVLVSVALVGEVRVDRNLRPVKRRGQRPRPARQAPADSRAGRSGSLAGRSERGGGARFATVPPGTVEPVAAERLPGDVEGPSVPMGEAGGTRGAGLAAERIGHGRRANGRRGIVVGDEPRQRLRVLGHAEPVADLPREPMALVKSAPRPGGAVPRLRDARLHTLRRRPDPRVAGRAPDALGLLQVRLPLGRPRLLLGHVGARRQHGPEQFAVADVASHREGLVQVGFRLAPGSPVQREARALVQRPHEQLAIAHPRERSQRSLEEGRCLLVASQPPTDDREVDVEVRHAALVVERLERAEAGEEVPVRVTERPEEEGPEADVVVHERDAATVVEPSMEPKRLQAVPPAGARPAEVHRDPAERGERRGQLVLVVEGPRHP